MGGLLEFFFCVLLFSLLLTLVCAFISVRACVCGFIGTTFKAGPSRTQRRKIGREKSDKRNDPSDVVLHLNDLMTQSFGDCHILFATTWLGIRNPNVRAPPIPPIKRTGNVETFKFRGENERRATSQKPTPTPTPGEQCLNLRRPANCIFVRRCATRPTTNRRHATCIADAAATCTAREF